MGKKPALAAATRQKLIDAFWQLYTKKSIEQISIKEITDLAGYNRGTFYLYFKDIYDVLNQIEDSILTPPTQYEAEDTPREVLLSQITIRMIIAQMASYFEKSRRYVGVLLSERGDPQFSYKLKQQLKALFALSPQLHIMDPALRGYYLEYSTSGLLAMLQTWLQTDSQMSVEDFIFTALRVMIPEASQELLAQLDEPLINLAPGHLPFH